MIDGLVLYWTFTCCFGLATVGFLVWTFRHPPNRRRYGVAIVLSCLAMTLANALMANEILTRTVDGAAYPHARFIGYFFAFGPIGWLLGTVAGADRPLTAKLIVAIYGLPGSVLASWNFSGGAASVASALVFVFIVVTVWLLVGPIYRATEPISGERRLLYGKLRNLSLLVWIVLPIIGVLSEQNLAILTSFAGIFLGSYMDLLLLVGVGVITLRSPTALDQLSAGGGNTDATDQEATTDSADPGLGVGSQQTRRF